MSDKPDYIEGLAREVEAAQAHRQWLAEGSKGMSVPFHGDFAFAVPSVLTRLAWWVRELRRERDERLAEAAAGRARVATPRGERVCRDCGTARFCAECSFVETDDDLRAEVARLTAELAVEHAKLADADAALVAAEADLDERRKELAAEREKRAAAEARLADARRVLYAITHDESTDGVDCAERWEAAARAYLAEPAGPAQR